MTSGVKTKILDRSVKILAFSPGRYQTNLGAKDGNSNERGKPVEIG